VLLNTLNDFYTPFDVIVLLDGKVTVLILYDLWAWARGVICSTVPGEFLEEN
jgi:hypothetical protein